MFFTVIVCIIELIIIRKLITRKIKLYFSFRKLFLFLKDSIIKDINIKKADKEIADGISKIPSLKNSSQIFFLASK